MADPEGKPEPKYERALVVAAHPDDPEFGFGATVAKLARDGVEVTYVICTDGSQGGEDPSVPDEELTATRYAEQRAAAEILGVREVVFLGFRDGHIYPTLDLRKCITREIRRHRPDVVMTHYPTRAVSIRIGASHPDHIAVGEATMAAVYPDSRNPRAYRELLDEGFEPHVVKEVWLPGFEDADHFVDVTGLLDLKLQAILAHKSQFQKERPPEWDPEKWIRERMREAGEKAGYEYAESFKRLEVG
jgi:LmbE family N-acetylglucosaminyl deacetylase